MTEALLLAAELMAAVTGIATGIAFLVRPVRNRVLGLNALREGQKCLLRGDMLSTYYKHRDSGTIRQFEYENFFFAYRAYKALGGNSFMDKISREVEEWEVVT